MCIYSYKQLIYCILTSKKHLNQQKNIPRVFHNNPKSFLQQSCVALQKISNWCIINPTNHYDRNAEPVKYAVYSDNLQLYLAKVAHVFLQQKLLTV